MNRGVISIARLYRLGYTKREITGLTGHGELRRLYRGVYADGRMTLSEDAEFAAALMAIGPQSWLAGRTAAMAWGLEPVSLAVLELATVASSTPAHAGLAVHRVGIAPHESEIVVRRGLRMSSVPRLLIEASASGASHELIRTLLESAVRRGALKPDVLAATLGRNAGRRGVGGVRAACGDYLPHPERKSRLEHSFDRWLSSQRDVVEPRRNVRMGPWEIDCFWPDQRLALELDGREYHIAASDFERDRRKDAWLQRRGIRVLRISEYRWRTDRRGAQEDLNTLLELGNLQLSS